MQIEYVKSILITDHGLKYIKISHACTHIPNKYAKVQTELMSAKSPYLIPLF